VILQNIGELIGGELAALVGVEDVGASVPGDGFFITGSGLDNRVSCHIMVEYSIFET